MQDSLHDDLLDQVRRDGDWETWLAFFLDGVRTTADGAASNARRLDAMFREDRILIEKQGRRAGSTLRVHEALKARPLLSLTAVAEKTGLAFPTVSDAMGLLVELGIARELTGKLRNRLFVYQRYLAALDEPT